jgi:hypothetical protein
LGGKYLAQNLARGKSIFWTQILVPFIGYEANVQKPQGSKTLQPESPSDVARAFFIPQKTI